MLNLEIFIGKLFSVDRFTAAAVALFTKEKDVLEVVQLLLGQHQPVQPEAYISEVATLEHKVGDNTMEDGSLVVQGFALLALTLFTSAQSTEVLGSLWHSVTEQT